ncbi:hypothetical protein MOX02_46420 [Methylobacterium oxalidis]|uniref:Uncharacterized protein n=1 Tax=Methylobacterium oxalidis TaxID=944322 RepID=A0A512J9F6_9HYPH|nr:hypothetical protein MOX02_46420 [Methylobacterium oxalidis]GLS66218.1 hypothetical protein GCM10007888_46000 [Methylobacterium oxalidis]
MTCFAGPTARQSPSSAEVTELEGSVREHPVELAQDGAFDASFMGTLHRSLLTDGPLAPLPVVTGSVPVRGRDQAARLAERMNRGWRTTAAGTGWRVAGTAGTQIRTWVPARGSNTVRTMIDSCSCIVA